MSSLHQATASGGEIPTIRTPAEEFPALSAQTMHSEVRHNEKTRVDSGPHGGRRLHPEIQLPSSKI